MLQFLRGADDGNMDSTLRSEEYAALVLPELDNLRAAYAWAAGEDGDRAVAIGLAAHAGPLIDYSNEFAEWLLAQHAAARRPAWSTTPPRRASGARWPPRTCRASAPSPSCSRRRSAPRPPTAGCEGRDGCSRRCAMSRSGPETGDIDGGQAAIDEAAALIEPDWAAEFRIVVLRFRARSSRRAGEHDAARRDATVKRSGSRAKPATGGSK